MPFVALMAPAHTPTVIFLVGTKSLKAEVFVFNKVISLVERTFEKAFTVSKRVGILTH